nr:ankyrin repeat domain-containing protein [uncultured Friedmanniella sp.]
MSRATDGVPSGDDPVELAHWLLDRARVGEGERLADYADHGMPVDLTDATGNTLLMLAAYHGHAGTVRLLAERGADVNAVNDRGQTPLAGAVFKGYRDVVEVLVAAGADPDLGSPTARDSAVFFERTEIAAMLPPPAG